VIYIAIAEYNEGEPSSGATYSKQCLVTKALGGATGTTQLKMRVENLAASRLGESSE